MAMIDTLFGLIPESTSLKQWVARELQVVNWGVFDGAHRVRLAPEATLLAGASGSGKSTLMDAYIALLMPHTTPFNGASNGSVIGRPRGKDQRNIISYARGKLDETRSSTGATTNRVLRGEQTDTWSAVAITWEDQSGAQFTGLRAWYVPTHATSMDGVLTLRATINDAFDLSQLSKAAEQKWSRNSTQALGLATFDTDKEFTARLYATLGIGAAGGGDKAAGLLARIQAGQQITTVDALYKAMVLEEPTTLAKADDVVMHFDELSATRELMLTAAAQLSALSPIRKYRAQIDESRARLAILDGITGTSGKLIGPKLSVLNTWRAEKRIELLREVEAEVRKDSWEIDRANRELEAQIQTRRVELAAIRQQLWVSGGDKMQNAERELVGATKTLEETRQARAQIDEAAQLFDVLVSNQGDFAQLVAEAGALLNEEGAATSSARDAALLTEKAVEAQLRALQQELAGLAKRRSNIPENLHRSRDALAAAAGLSPDQLPFVGELIEVQVAHENWRDAFNLALGGFATTLLVPDGKLAAFRAAIDSVPVPVRVRFEGVSLNSGVREHLDPVTLPGRLDYANSPFADALKGILASRFAYVCVSDPAQLGDFAKALTRSGQTSDGQRGAHGGSGRVNVLGFTNSRAVTSLETQIAAKQRELQLAADAFRGADLRVKALRQQQAAATLISRTTWESIDIKSAAQAVARWQDVIESAETDNPEAADLSARAAALDSEISALTEKLGAGKTKATSLNEKWEGYSDQVDEAQAVLDQAEETGLTISPTARDYLYKSLSFTAQNPENPDGTSEPDHAKVSPIKALANFDAVMQHAAERLANDQATAYTALDNALTAMRTVFQHYLNRWPNPNLGTDPDGSYGDFDRILLNLETDGLHSLEAEWSRSLAQLTGADLADLDRTLRRALTEITERIQPVNDILANLPFNDSEHRLQITCHTIDSALVNKFRRQLRELSGANPTQNLEERNAWYRKMATLIERIRPGSPERADLIDVRRQVRLSAEKVDLAGNHVALYDHIGEKSGGESQELVAFIVGAALRYQLGDAGAERPRYAPVFLDEALIKADAKFTGRALGAWRGLGFQLIIGAPNDKVSALEPHVSASYVVVKNNQGRSQARPIVSLAA